MRPPVADLCGPDRLEHYTLSEVARSTGSGSRYIYFQKTFLPPQASYASCFMSIEIAQNTGSSYRPYIDELDRVLSSLRPDWAGLYYQSYEENKTRMDWNTNLLCLAVAHEMGVCLGEVIINERAKILDSNRRPLLCYYFDQYIVWLPSPLFLQTLIDYGADLNERFQEFTPWTWAVKRQYDKCDRFGAEDSDSVEMFRTMLEHGVNPVQRVYLDGFKYCYHRNSHLPQTLVYTTTFHLVFSFFRQEPPYRLELVRFFLSYCKDFDAAGSDGTTILAWAQVENERFKEARNRETRY